MINATDNIIISTCININAVSVYSNYLLVVTYLNTFASMIYNGFLSSLGNFLVTETDERKHELFKKINFLGFSIFSFSSVVLLNVFNVFIELIANKEYLLPISSVVLIILNFYVTGMRMPASNMKTAAGLFDIDKYTPIIQSIVNITFSIILAIPFGINGVLLGTLISSIHPSFQRPSIVYKNIIKKDYKEYCKEYINYFSFTVLVSFFVWFVLKNIVCTSLILELVIKLLISIISYIVIYLITFYRNERFIFYKEMLLKILKRGEL